MSDLPLERMDRVQQEREAATDELLDDRRETHDAEEAKREEKLPEK
jgi:hypothetical protein